MTRPKLTSWTRWSCLLLLCGFGTAVAQQLPRPPRTPKPPETPAEPTKDPVGSVLDEILKGGQPSAEVMKPTGTDQAAGQDRPDASQPPEKDMTGSPDSVIDGILSEGAKLQEQRRDEARQLLDQANSRYEAGDYRDADDLVQRAAKLAPENEQVADLAGKVERKLAEQRDRRRPLLTAKAHLAAALNQGRQLAREERTDDAVDLLQGVLRAVDLFPKDANVDFYRTAARQELAKLPGGDKAIDAAAESDPSADPTVAEQAEKLAAPPRNAGRLLFGELADRGIPPWYARLMSRLRRPVSVDYSSATMPQVLDDLSRQTGVEFVVDPQELFQARDARTGRGGSVRRSIDMRLAGVTAETVLNVACEMAEVDYVPMEKAVVVTTNRRAKLFAQDLGEAVRKPWLFARVLFPGLDPDLVVSAPQDGQVPPRGQPRPDGERRAEVEPYLRSGDALVEDIRRLLA